jgi:hypothetical protein
MKLTADKVTPAMLEWIRQRVLEQYPEGSTFEAVPGQTSIQVTVHVPTRRSLAELVMGEDER